MAMMDVDDDAAVATLPTDRFDSLLLLAELDTILARDWHIKHKLKNDMATVLVGCGIFFSYVPSETAPGFGRLPSFDPGMRIRFIEKIAFFIELTFFQPTKNPSLRRAVATIDSAASKVTYTHERWCF